MVPPLNHKSDLETSFLPLFRLKSINTSCRTSSQSPFLPAKASTNQANV